MRKAIEKEILGTEAGTLPQIWTSKRLKIGLLLEFRESRLKTDIIFTAGSGRKEKGRVGRKDV